MSEHNDLDQGNKTSDDYERDIEQTREEIDETISSLEDKLSPQQIWNKAVDDWSGGVKEFSGNFGRTLRDNPVPAVLMGVSMLWLMTDPGGEKRHFKGRSSHSTGESFGEKYQKVKSGVSQKVKNVGDSVNENYSDIKEKVGDAIDTVSSKVNSASDTISDHTDDMQRKSSYMKERSASQVSDLIGNPLFLAIAGVALGSLVALSVPVTKKEEQLMEEKGEDLIEKAKEASKEKYEQGKEVAASAAEAAAKTIKNKVKETKKPASSESHDPVKTSNPSGGTTVKSGL